MRKSGLKAMLAIFLLVFAAGASANEVTATLPATADRNLDLVVRDYVKSPAWTDARVKPTALCASDGKVWSCTPENALRGQPVINVDGAVVRNNLSFGRLDTASTPCICERKDDDSPWVCTPPGCMGTFAGPRADPRVDERIAPPARRELGAPQQRR